MAEAGAKKHRRRHQVKEVQPALSFNDVSLTDFDEENAMEDNKDTKEHAEDWDGVRAQPSLEPTIGADLQASQQRLQPREHEQGGGLPPSPPL